MYAATREPNMKWGTQILNGGLPFHCHVIQNRQTMHSTGRSIATSEQSTSKESKCAVTYFREPASRI